MNLYSPEFPHLSVENDSNELSAERDLVLPQFMHGRDAFSVFPCCVSVPSLVALCSSSRPIILMAEWICRWKRFWIPIGDTFQKAYLEEWQLVHDGSKRDPSEDNLQTSPNTGESAKPLRSGSNDVTFKQETPWDTSSAPKSSRQALGEPDAPTWKLSGTHSTSAFWEKSEAPSPPQKCVCSKIHPEQHSPFPERLKLLYPDEEILSGNEEDVSFMRDGFATCVKADF